jgi:hypothetical protein
MLSLMSLFHNNNKHVEGGFNLSGLLKREGARLRREAEEKKKAEEALRAVSLELHRTNHLLVGPALEYWRWFVMVKNGHCLGPEALTKLVEKELGVPVTLVYYLPSPPDVILIYEEQQRLKELEEMMQTNEYLQVYWPWMLR